MAIAVHIMNTPKVDVRVAYQAAWQRIDEQGLRHPEGRHILSATMVGHYRRVRHPSACGRTDDE
jgi:hypothetical protein